MTALCQSDRFVEINSDIAELFDADVRACAVDPRVPQPPLFPSEAEHVMNAVPKRQAEYAAGRAAARSALGQLGHPPCAIPSAASRAPVWPAGISGSISHATGLCAAVVTRAPMTLGLDIEECDPLSPDLISIVCTPEERQAIAGPAAQALAKRIFSAKEAVYKAQYPISQTLISFDHVGIELKMGYGTFQATILKPLPGFSLGDRIAGRTAVLADHIVSAAWVDCGR